MYYRINLTRIISLEWKFIYLSAKLSLPPSPNIVPTRVYVHIPLFHQSRGRLKGFLTFRPIRELHFDTSNLSFNNVNRLESLLTNCWLNLNLAAILFIFPNSMDTILLIKQSRLERLKQRKLSVVEVLL